MPRGQSDAQAAAAAAVGVKPPVKGKFDPNTLDASVRPVYDSMLAEFTKKTQGASKIQKDAETKLSALQKQIDDLTGTIQYYERLLPSMYGGQGADPNAGVEEADRGAEVRGEAGVNGEVQWNPFDPEGVRSVAQAEIASYHKKLEKVYNQLVKGIMELQAYNLQLMKVQLTPLAQKLGVELPDLNKIIQAAPQYGYNLEQAYRAVYESPDIWKRATEHGEIVKERDSLKEKLAAAEAARASTGLLGGTTGPVPRTVAKGQKPRTYQEVAASISPAEIFGGEGGAGAGTADGAGGGGTTQ